MNDRELYADLIQAILDGENDEKIFALLSCLRTDELQDLALAASNLSQLCRMAWDAADDGDDDQAAREPRPEFIEGGRENTASVQARWT